MKSCVILATLGQVLLILFLKSQSLEANIYCVSENKSCNTNLTESCVECHPLMWFVDKTVMDIISNDSTIIFLPGEHSLNSHEQNEAVIIFLNKNNLTLMGNGPANESSTVVCSGEQSGFLFQNSSDITVHNLRFQGCGANMTDGFRDCIFFDYSYNIEVSQVLIKGCKGFGLHTSNVCGNISIKYSHFEKTIGNAIFWFEHCKENSLTLTFVYVHNSHFLNGIPDSRMQYSTGIYLIILRSKVTVSLSKLKLTNNRGNHGGNIAIQFFDFAHKTSKVIIEDSHLEQGYASSSGGGMVVWFEKTWQSDLDKCTKHEVHKRTVLKVKNTVFTGNRAYSGGGVNMAYHERPGTGCTTRLVEFTNCTFTNNLATRGGAIVVSKHKVPIFVVHNSPQLTVILQNCLIKNNTLILKRDQDDEEGIVQIFSVESLVIDNTRLLNNNGTALFLVGSGVQFQNESIFENNSAKYGGAIKLCESSVMYFDNDTHVKFIQNSARSAGGAIYVGNLCLQESPPCFFQIKFNFSTANPPTIKELAEGILYFHGNQAEIAGKAIYGGSVDHCFIDTELKFNPISQHGFNSSLPLFYQIFTFSNHSEISLVTSDPYGVCTCDYMTNSTNCSEREIHLIRYAGEYFTVNVSAVGQTNGSVPSKILLDYKQNSSFCVERRNREDIPHILYVLCHSLELVIFPKTILTNATFQLGIIQNNAVSESSNYFRIPKLIVNVEIPPCPFLFELNVYKGCDCPEYLKSIDVSCKINNRTITRPVNTWIGCSHDINDTADKCKTVSLSTSCQENRCSNHRILTKDNFSEICVEGRDGRVCGKCKLNYSLSLGPLNCIPDDGNCSMWWSALLSLIFFLAGFLLICFISFFNLTVTEGTVSGLFFYANCIQANQDAFYVWRTPFFRIFISWLNLDFGFPVCFYSGMTAYQKFWLEYSFILYLFILGSLIVCMSHKFIWFTRLAGRNMVPVLATVIVVSYSKLVRNSTEVWNCDSKDYWSSDNSTSWIWHSDETVDCFGLKHLILLVFSIFFFIVASLYTLCLLFIQCLQRGSGWCVLRWVNKLRPFFDANTGPCRDHYQFWPGFLLFIRLGLFITFFCIVDPSQRAYILMAVCLFIFFLACVSPHGVYKKWPLNLLEFSFFLNLSITAGAVADKYSFSYAFAYTSMAIAAFTFLLILIFHCYKKLRETRRWKKVVAKIRKNRSRNQRVTVTKSLPSEISPLIRPGHGMPPVIEFTAPREPLLEDD